MSIIALVFFTLAGGCLLGWLSAVASHLRWGHKADATLLALAVILAVVGVAVL